jgi:hypothetical protein
MATTRVENELSKLILGNIELSGKSIMVDEITTFVADNFKPDDIFSKGELEEWARDNGYIHENDSRE